MDKWNKLANKETVDITIKALKSNGINALFVENKEINPNRITLIFVGEKLGF